MPFSLSVCHFIILSLLPFSLVSGGKDCSRQLEEIIFVPPVCAFEYLKKISQEIRLGKALLWTPLNASLIDTFQQKYDVFLVINDAMGISTKYTYSTYQEALSHALLNDDPSSGYITEHSNAIGGAFVNNGTHYKYKTIYWNNLGQMYYVKIVARKAVVPYTCNTE